MASLSAVLLAALVTGPFAPVQDRAIKPGTYDLEIVYGGGTTQGTLTVSVAGDSLATTLLVAGHESPVKPTKREGARVVLESANGVSIRYDLVFKGDEVSGRFVYEGQPGSLTGRRRAGT